MVKRGRVGGEVDGVGASFDAGSEGRGWMSEWCGVNKPRVRELEAPSTKS